jgi:hypothetical protein
VDPVVRSPGGLARRLVRRARRLPPGVQAPLRRAVLEWGRATARWRMQPAFLVIGAQRAGTTTLFRLLGEHPSVVRPTATKGIGYFDVGYRNGPRWYAAHFPLAWRRRGQVTFESSGYYSFHPLAAGRIAADLPGVKVVMMVRDPVDRAYSAHSHEVARGFEDLGFEAALAAEPTRLEGAESWLVEHPDGEHAGHRHHAYLARGRYAEQLDRFAAALGPDRVRAVDFDRFVAAPVEELQQLFAWLGLPEWRPDQVVHENARSRSPLAPELRASLLAHFADWDARLEPYLGHRPSWRDPA